MYMGAHDTPVHQSRDGSFELKAGKNLDEVLSHARLLGANCSARA